jgi:hypothetical protein
MIESNHPGVSSGLFLSELVSPIGVSRISNILFIIAHNGGFAKWLMKSI